MFTCAEKGVPKRKGYPPEIISNRLPAVDHNIQHGKFDLQTFQKFVLSTGVTWSAIVSVFSLWLLKEYETPTFTFELSSEHISCPQ